MDMIQNMKFDKERALYGSNHIAVLNCSFEGPEDGESALKESMDILVDGCFCDLRYPFWHDTDLIIVRTEMTENCRAAIWYSKNVKIADSKLHGIKALRECSDVYIEDCDMISPEFGWSVNNITMKNSTAESEYFMMRSSNINFENVRFKGKYSFQYIENAVFENCDFMTKDAFWHGKNITVRNSRISGEYFAWYSEGLTLENCTISGTQPLCYCKGLKLENCRMEDADLSFEKSDVEAEITNHVISIKNPRSGYIEAPSVGEIIMDSQDSECEIRIGK